MKWSEVCVRISDPTTQHGFPLHECFPLIEIELNKLIELEMTDTKKLLRLSEYFEWVRRISLCRRTAALCVCTLCTVRTREGWNATLNISTSFFDQLANCPTNDFTLFPWLKDNSFTCRYSLLRMLLRTNRSGGNRTPYKNLQTTTFQNTSIHLQSCVCGCIFNTKTLACCPMLASCCNWRFH